MTTRTIFSAVFFTAILFVFSACDNEPNEPAVVSVTGVTLNESNLTLTVGGSETLIATVAPANATNRAVTWLSDDEDVATVNVNGVVTAVSLGTATITVTTVDGAHTTTATVAVIMPATGVTLDRSALEIIVGETETLIATVLPENATNTAIIWTSDDETVATVNNNGLVTAVSRGTTTITVTTEDGDFTADATVTVIDPIANPDGVVINGIRWATSNVDAPGTFAENPESRGMFYQWNRRVGWSSTGTLVSSDGSYWDNTTSIDTSWTRENDPCPEGWRVPTQSELIFLAGAGSTWTTRNGINGRVFGTAPNQIFLPAASFRRGSNGMLGGVGAPGNYWSSTQDDGALARFLRFSNTGFTGVSSSNRSYGFSVRCVAED